MKPIYLLIVLFFAAFTLTACSGTQPVACTMEAKICSDGSSVGRTGPNCQFAPCPDEKIYVGNSPEQCQVIKFVCVQGKQYFSDDKGCGCEPISGKLKAIDCTVRNQMCTEEYMPVCGQVQVECIRAPCPPINETFGNKCQACANPLTISYFEGECPK